MRTYNNSIVIKFDTTATGNAGAGKPVTVYEAGTVTKAELFNAAEQTITNPINADNEGNYSFKVANGIYDIVIDQGLPTQVKIENELITDAAGGGSGSSAIETIELTSGQVLVQFTVNTEGASFYINGTGADNGRILESVNYSYNQSLNQVTLTNSYPSGTYISAIRDTGYINEDYVRYFDELSGAVSSTKLVIGDQISLKERTAGNGGGAMWNVVLASTVTPNTYNIVACTGVPTLALKLPASEEFTFARLGIFPDSTDITSDFQAVIDLIISRGATIGSRVQVESVGIEPGIYTQDGEVNLKSIRDFKFYAVNGGKGSVVIDTSGSSSSSDSYIADNAAFGTFENITWKGLVNNDTNLFAFGSDTSLIRSWDFIGCDMIAIKRCFRVTGTLLCSEFSFINSDFLQCHTLMYNNNTQAVNWNFTNCNWENDSLIFSGDNATSTLLFANKGTFLTWAGGSVIAQGGLVFCNWNAVGDAFRTSHKVAFDKVRIEIHPTTDSVNPPLVDRIASGYVNASNSMPVTFTSGTGLIRGGVVSPYIWANVWNKSSLTVDSCEWAGGDIHGPL